MVTYHGPGSRMSVARQSLPHLGRVAQEGSNVPPPRLGKGRQRVEASEQCEPATDPGRIVQSRGNLAQVLDRRRVGRVEREGAVERRRGTAPGVGETRQRAVVPEIVAQPEPGVRAVRRELRETLGGLDVVAHARRRRVAGAQDRLQPRQVAAGQRSRWAQTPRAGAVSPPYHSAARIAPTPASANVESSACASRNLRWASLNAPRRSSASPSRYARRAGSDVLVSASSRCSSSPAPRASRLAASRSTSRGRLSTGPSTVAWALVAPPATSMILALTVSEWPLPTTSPCTSRPAPTSPAIRIASASPSSPARRPVRAPRGEDGARVGRAQARGAAELGGQQVDHPLAQVGERGVGAGDAKGRDRDDLAVDAQVPGAGCRPGQREHERGRDDAAGGQPAAAAGRLVSHRHGSGAFRRGPNGLKRREHLVRLCGRSAGRFCRSRMIRRPSPAGRPARRCSTGTGVSVA